MKSIRTVILTALLVFTPIWAQAEKATFAGGCFWCVEAAFQDLDGVSSAVSGFTGGDLQNPTYRGNHKGHYEAVEVEYDPEVISYAELLQVYWRNIDPFDKRGQFCDKGFEYLSAIFTHNEEQKALAESTKAAVMERFPEQEVATRILSSGQFWPVNEGHQDYYLKNPVRYKFYRTGCRRDARLKQIWGAPVDKH